MGSVPSISRLTDTFADCAAACICSRRVFCDVDRGRRMPRRADRSPAWPATGPAAAPSRWTTARRERIRCRATYAVRRRQRHEQSLTCASDSLQVRPARQRRRRRRRRSPGPGAKPAATSAATSRAAAAAAISRSSRSAAGFTANIALTHTRQQAVGRDPRRQRVPRRRYLAVEVTRSPICCPRADPRAFALRLCGLRLGQLVRGFLHGLGDQQGLLLVEREILHAFMRGQRKHHDVGLVLGPAGGEGGHEIG